jgi:hypothetical protein
MIIGKETFCAKMKKNKCESDFHQILRILKGQTDFEVVKVFEVDEGKTDNDLEFVTWRFYFKKKSEDKNGSKSL